ncbi:hypothetical protein SPHINGO8AM_150058 [Sphingomonas sp. 8AM]|nr:hypothetical protein SPHINGO8AM_150058 [Sphingomonas sp. 8AM]
MAAWPERLSTRAGMRACGLPAPSTDLRVRIPACATSAQLRGHALCKSYPAEAGVQLGGCFS